MAIANIHRTAPVPYYVASNRSSRLVATTIEIVTLVNAVTALYNTTVFFSTSVTILAIIFFNRCLQRIVTKNRTS